LKLLLLWSAQHSLSGFLANFLDTPAEEKSAQEHAQKMKAQRADQQEQAVITRRVRENLPHYIDYSYDANDPKQDPK
jgi:hypothetical protein